MNILHLNLLTEELAGYIYANYFACKYFIYSGWVACINVFTFKCKNYVTDVIITQTLHIRYKAG